MLIAVGSYADAAALRDYGIRTVATVIEVHDSFKNPSVEVRFTTEEGDEVVATISDFQWDPKPRVGDEASVIYDPDAPDINIVDARVGPDFLFPWLAAVGAAVAGLYGLLLLTRRTGWRRRRGGFSRRRRRGGTVR